MAYTGQRKWYTKELLEICIDDMEVTGEKFTGVQKKGLNFTEFKIPCYVEGVKVGYGIRYFFRCYKCGRRVTKIYTIPNPTKDNITGCRHCLELNYISQQATKTQIDYEAHLLYRYGRMLDPNFKLDTITHTPCPWKPKNMHYKTYERIRHKYEMAQLKAQKKFIAMVGASMQRMEKRFGTYGIDIKNKY